MPVAFVGQRKRRERVGSHEPYPVQASDPSCSASGVPLFLQRKTAIGQPGDVFEQEADRVAEAVMSDTFALGDLHDEPGIQRKCAACAASSHNSPACKEEEEDKLAQRKPDASAASFPTRN